MRRNTADQAEVSVLRALGMAELGERVSDRWGHEGTLEAIYLDFVAASADFVTMTREEWLRRQTVPFSLDQLEEPWGKVRCDDGGTTMSPMSMITPL